MKSVKIKPRDKTFFTYMENVSCNLERRGQGSTAKGYRSALRSFSRFRKQKDIKIQNINTEEIHKYEKYLKDRNLTLNTISFYMRILHAVYNRAVEDNITQNNYPFKTVYRGIDKTAKRAVDKNIVTKLKDVDLSKHKGLEIARDLFLFSFFTRGMAFVDIAHLKKENINNNNIIYRRKKTGQLLKIRVEPAIQQLISKYYHINKQEFLFPILSKNRTYASALRIQNKRLSSISKILEIIPVLTSYTARHSWATIAFKKGVSIRVISESMGHENEMTTRIYLASLDQTDIDQANASIILDL